MIKRNLLLCLLGAMSICLAECGLKEKIATYVMLKLNNINFNYIVKSLLFYILQIYILCVRHFKNAYVEK